jgi:hypothetical protein
LKKTVDRCVRNPRRESGDVARVPWNFDAKKRVFPGVSSRKIGAPILTEA